MNNIYTFNLVQTLQSFIRLAHLNMKKTSLNVKYFNKIAEIFSNALIAQSAQKQKIIMFL